MQIRRTLGLCVLIALSGACGSAGTDAEPVVVEVSEPADRDVVYGAAGSSSSPALDVWAPPGADGAPVMVLLDGAPPARTATEPMAIALANKGFLVINADWRLNFSLTTGGPYDAACLVRFARANADEFGGDPNNVSLVGYSAGGSLAALLALNGEAITGQCSQDESLSAVPDSIIGLAGGYEYLVLDSPEPSFGDQIIADDPNHWALMNPYEHLDAAEDVSALLIHGASDVIVSVGSTERFAAALAAAGADITTHVLPDVGHALTQGAPLDTIVDQIDAWVIRD